MTSFVDSRLRSVSSRVAAWAALGFAGYIVIGLGSLLAIATVEEAILEPLGLGGEPGTSSWGIVLASHPLVWGAATAMAAAPLGRRLIPGGLRREIRPAVVLAVGLGLAAITTYLLHEFARERYGWFDSDYVGLVVFAAPALVAIALAGWAADILPRGGTPILFVALAAAVAGLGLAILPSVPGLQDGIRASSIPLATVLAVDVAYGTASLLLAARSLRHQAARTDAPGDRPGG